MAYNSQSPEVKRVSTVAERMVALRASHESDYQEIAEYICPDKGMTDDPDNRNRESRFGRLYDGSAIRNADRLAASLSWMLTNPQTAWFNLATINPSLRGVTSVERYLERVRDMVRVVLALPETAFYTSVAEAYSDLAGFATAVVGRFYSPSKGVRFQARPLSECYIDEDSDGRVVRVLRRWKMRADEVVETFGENAAPQAAKMVRENKGAEKLRVEHLVEKMPPDSIRNTLPLYRQITLEFASVYCVEGETSPVKYGGFDELPYVVARWDKAGTTPYGTGPGHRSLADVKTMNAASRSMLRLGQKAADPPMTAPDDGIVGGRVNTGPGGLTLLDRSLGAESRPQPLNTGASPDIARWVRDSLEVSVKQNYFDDVRSLPMNDRMTAAEIFARQSSGMAVLSPYAFRIQQELLSPMVLHVLKALRRQNALPEPPPELRGQGVVVEFSNAMASSQSSQRVIGTQRWLNEVISPLASIDPSVIDLVEPDGIARTIAHDLGATAEGLRSREDVEARRAQRAQAEQGAQGVAEAGAIASAGRDAAAAVRDLSAAGLT